MLSFIVYFPIISLMTGAPLPFPSLFEPTASQIALLNGINVSIAIIGSIVGATFYLERRNNKKIEKMADTIIESTLALRTELKELHNEIKNMESRISSAIDQKIDRVEKLIDDKVMAAKQLEDERIRNILNRLNRMEGGGSEGWRYKMKKKDKTNDGTDEEGDEYEGEDLNIDR